jgi:hypothetical protein
MAMMLWGEVGHTDAHLRLHALELFCIHLEGLPLP